MKTKVRPFHCTLSGLSWFVFGVALPALFWFAPERTRAQQITTNYILVTNTVVVTNYSVTTNLVLITNSVLPDTSALKHSTAAVLPSGFYPWLTPSQLVHSNRFDWIQLRSGEWLKGKLKSMQEEKLEFDSEELDVHNFDLEKVITIYSPRTESLRFEHGEPVTGSLLVTSNEVYVISPSATNVFSRQDLIAITPTGTREVDKWSAHVSAGMSFRSGNTRQIDYNAHLALQRRTPSTRLTFDYLGNYGELDGVQTEQNHRFYGQFDYFLSRRLFVRLPYVEYSRDPPANVAHRLILSGELGYDLVKNRRVEWNITAGPAWQRNWFASVETNELQNANSAAITFGSKLDVELTRRIDFILEYRGQFSSRETGGNSHHAVATLEFEVHKRLNLDLSFTWDRTANPETDAGGHTPQADDFRLNMGLGVDF